MNDFKNDYFWIMIVSAVVSFFTIAILLAEALKLIPVDIF
jgi:hypothetical protein